MSTSRFEGTLGEFLRVVIWLFMAFSLPGLLAGGWHGLVAALALSLVMAAPVMLAFSKIGVIAGKLSKGRSAATGPDESLAYELSLIRCDVALENYDEALRNINEILRRNPEEPEALYLKAQIAWRGYRNFDSAVNCLKKVMAVTDPQDQYHPWARNFLGEISGCRGN